MCYRQSSKYCVTCVGGRDTLQEDSTGINIEANVPAANLGGLEGGVNRCGVGNIGLEAVHVAQRAQFLYGGGNGGIVDIPEIFMFF